MYNINDKIKTMFGGVLHDGIIVGKHGTADYYAVKLDDGTACYRYGADFVKMNYLDFEKRGCDFFPGDKNNDESDIGNYRICTPGEIVPLKDGRKMLFEFGCYDRKIWRFHNKRNGNKLKKPVVDSVFTCATSIDTEFSKREESGFLSSWRDLNMETEFYKTPRKYTEKNILDYINSVSAVHYDAIRYV